MLCALISDIHGNLEALTAVLRDVEHFHVDAIHCLGDVIGYGPDPGPCVELVNTTCDIKLMGNHEQAACGMLSVETYNPAARKSALWTIEQLSDAHFDMIRRYRIDAHRENMYLVHASPYHPDEWRYILSPEEALLAFSCFEEQICFNGHTHLPVIFSESPNGDPRLRVGHSFMPDEHTRYIVNIGSVGQPRDKDPRACYALYDSTEEEIIYRRVEYDIKTAQQKMEAADLPEVLITRLSQGR